MAGPGATIAAHGALGAGAADAPAGHDQHRGEQGKRQAAGLHAACNEDAWSG